MLESSKNANLGGIVFWPRLAIWLLLQCEEDRFWMILGTPCSSWIHLNVGTSRRSILNADGDLRHRYVREANSTLSRTGVVLCLGFFKGKSPIIGVMLYSGNLIVKAYFFKFQHTNHTC